MPRELYGPQALGHRLNSAGLDLSNKHRLGSLAAALLTSAATPWRAVPMLGGSATVWDESRAVDVRNPADHRDVVGRLFEADAQDVQSALEHAVNAAPIWQSTSMPERASCLRRAA